MKKPKVKAYYSLTKNRWYAVVTLENCNYVTEGYPSKPEALRRGQELIESTQTTQVNKSRGKQGKPIQS